MRWDEDMQAQWDRESASGTRALLIFGVLVLIGVAAFVRLLLQLFAC